MRTNLSIDDLNGFLEEPHLAVLATGRADGSTLLSPVWHRWHAGGFEFWIGADDVKVRHLRRDPRASVVVAESELPYRGVEVRGEATFVEDAVEGSAIEIASRYVGAEVAEAYVRSLTGNDLLVRVQPGDLRIWDFADDFPSG
jgi:PPOX class probable F420-dependent enzyme